MVPSRLLRPPPLPERALPRAALQAALARGRDERFQVTLLWGPPGAGKTMAAAVLLSASDGPGLWIALDGLTEVDALSERMAAALQRAWPAAATRFADLLREAPSAEQVLHHAAGLWAFELEKAAPDGALVVLDGADAMAATALGAAWLEHLAELFPPNGQLLITSRTRAPLELATLRLQGAVLEVGPDALLVPPAEAREAGLAEEAIAAAEGWVPVLHHWPNVEAVQAYKLATLAAPAPAPADALKVAAAMEGTDPAGAIARYLAVGARADATRVLARIGGDWLDRGRTSRVGALLAAFPEEARGGAWWLLEADLARLAGRVEAASGAAERALGLATAEGDDVLRGRTLLCQAVLAAMRGDEAHRTLATEALAVFPADDDQDRARAENMLAIYCLQRLDEPGWRAHLAAARAGFLKADDRAGEARALHNLGLGLAQVGDLTGAAKAYDEALEACRASGRLPFPQTHVNLGVVRGYMGALDDGAVQAEQGLQLARELGSTREQGYALWALGKLQALGGRWALAASLFEEALGTTAGDRHLEVDARAGLAEVALRRGLPAEAWSRVEEAAAMRGLPWHAAEVFELAPVGAGALATLGRAADARTGLEHLLAEIETRGDSPYRHAQVLLALAALAPDGAGRTRLRERALALVTRHGYDALLRRATGAETAERPGDVAVQAFGRLEVSADGQTIPTERWGGPRVRLLLAYMVMRRRGASRDEIEASFFGGGAASRSAVPKMIGRLREALGPAVPEDLRERLVVLEDGRYQLGPGLAIDLDLARFDHLLDLASTTGRRDERAAAALLEEALDLYRGPLLAEFDDAWIEPERARARLKAIDALERLGASLLAEGRAAEALRRAERLGRDEPLAIEPVELRLRALAALGRRDEAGQVAKKAVARLQRELGAEPVQPLVELARQIARGAYAPGRSP